MVDRLRIYDVLKVVHSLDLNYGVIDSLALVKGARLRVLSLKKLSFHFPV